MKGLIAAAIVVASFMAFLAWGQSTQLVDPSAKQYGKTSEVTAIYSTDANYSETMPAVALPGRRSIEIQNNGPNNLKCRVGDGGTFTRVVAASGGVFAADIGAAVPLQCKVLTATQTTGAATAVTEIR